MSLLTLLLKILSGSEFLMSTGSAFQSLGALAANDLSP